MASMVVIFLPETWDRRVWQERTGTPSTCTVHAPQSPAPQPNLVPVSPTSSRITHNSGVSASALTYTALPLRVNLVAMLMVLLGRCRGATGFCSACHASV